MLQIGASFFLSISRAVCYRMIDWKYGIELALNYGMKRLGKALNFVRLLAHEPWMHEDCPPLLAGQKSTSCS